MAAGPSKHPIISFSDQSDESDDSDPFGSCFLLTPVETKEPLPENLFTSFGWYFRQSIFLALLILRKNILFIDKIRHVCAKTVETFHFNAIGYKILTSPSLSALAVISEAYSGHIMAGIISCYFEAKIVGVLCETGIKYRISNCSKIDYSFILSPNIYGIGCIGIETKRIRSRHFGRETRKTQADIDRILNKANYGALVSNSTVSSCSKWDFLFLHVLTDKQTVIPMICEWILNNHCYFDRIVVTVVDGNDWML